MYHYAANNPVRYTDPDGRELNSWKINVGGTEIEDGYKWKILGAICYIGAVLIIIGTGSAILVTEGVATPIVIESGRKAASALIAVGTVAIAKGIEIDVRNAQIPSVLKLRSSAPVAVAPSISPNDDNDEFPNFKDKNQIAKKFGNSNTNEFENSTKKDILGDAKKLGDEGNKGLKKFLRENKNPDIGVDKKGNIWLRSRINGSVINTELQYSLYMQ